MDDLTREVAAAIHTALRERHCVCVEAADAERAAARVLELAVPRESVRARVDEVAACIDEMGRLTDRAISEWRVRAERAEAERDRLRDEQAWCELCEVRLLSPPDDDSAPGVCVSCHNRAVGGAA